MTKRKRLYYDSCQSVKARQHKVKKRLRRVHDFEMDDLVVNKFDRRVNKRRRPRVGHVEKKYET